MGLLPHAFSHSPVLDTCFQDVWTAVDLNLNKMCLAGSWADDRFARDPKCQGADGNKTARTGTEMTVAQARMSVPYCAAYGATNCNSNFVGVNKVTGACYCVTGMDCDTATVDATDLQTGGHYLFAKEPAPGLSAWVVSMVT